MARLSTCSDCGTHVFAGSACPHCGGRSPSGRRAQAAIALLVGLSLTGCDAMASMDASGPEGGDPTIEVDPIDAHEPKPCYGVEVMPDLEPADPPVVPDEETAPSP